MESFNDKGKTIQKLLNSGHQIVFAYFLNRTHYLELGHFINGIDVIDAFVFILIPLMNRVDPNKAGLPIGTWFFSFANKGNFRPCFLKGVALPLIRR